MNEREKYEAMWRIPGYRNRMHSELLFKSILATLKPQAGQSLIDFGCGPGRPGPKLEAMGVKVTLVDIAENALDAGVSTAFLRHDISEPLPIHADLGICTDVMEHIPPDLVRQTLTNVLDAADRVYFSICVRKEGWGNHIGETLHLTVRSKKWWEQELGEVGEILGRADPGPGRIVFYARRKDAQQISTSAESGAEERAARTAG